MDALKPDVYGVVRDRRPGRRRSDLLAERLGIFIDDDSTGENQDSAIAFRKTSLEMVGGPSDLDADNELFADDQAANPGRHLISHMFRKRPFTLAWEAGIDIR